MKDGAWHVKTGKGNFCLLRGMPDGLVTIGNIYENPKLLEEN